MTRMIETLAAFLALLFSSACGIAVALAIGWMIGHCAPRALIYLGATWALLLFLFALRLTRPRCEGAA